MNIAHLLRRTARVYADKLAFIDGERRLTFAEADAESERLAQGLSLLGVSRGDRVALVLENCVDFPLCSFGITKCGGVVVPLLVRSTVPELTNWLRTADVTAVFTSANALDHVRNACAELDRPPSIIAVGAGGSMNPDAISKPDLIARVSDEPLDIELSGEDLFTIRFTGGTTGQPKGVTSSHRGYVSLYTNLLLNLPIDGTDVALHVHPLSHAAGQLMYGYFAAGATQVIHPAFGLEPAAVLKAIEDHGVTSVFIVPTVLQGLVDCPDLPSTNTSSLRSIIYGGAPTPVEHLRRGQESFGDVFVQIYGTSEAPQVTTTLTRDDHAFAADEAPSRLRSVGREVLNVEVRVVDDEDRPLPTGETGEIAIRGDNTMVGYWRNDELTAKRVRNGWVHTGDMGYYDADGYLYLVDRKDDLIITGGFNVWPSEIEAALYEHADVQEAVVFGVQDSRWGEAVTAAVLPRVGSGLDEPGVIQFLTERLSRYKVPKRVFIRSTSVPKSAVGKPLRRKARDEHVSRSES